MPSTQNKAWFRSKKNGYDCGLPCEWQGWAVLVAFVVLATTATVLLAGDHPAWYAATFVSLGVSLATICFLKREKPDRCQEEKERE